MSSLTDEWQLKINENSIKYIIDISNFDKKIKTFRTGREIYSKDFKIGRSTVRVKIFPGGDYAENKSYVSAFLQNRSTWRIKAKATFSIHNSNVERNAEEYFKSDDYWGFSQLIPHDRCKRTDLLASDGVLTLQVDVELLEEEVIATRDLTHENAIEKLENLEQTVCRMKETIQEMDIKNQSQTNELKSMISSLSLRFPDASQQPKPSMQQEQLECPVCMEVARPPMRLKQCGQGHIICDSCHAKAEEEANAQWEEDEGARGGNPDLDLCHTCRGVITGRPSALERILGLS